MCPFFLDNEDNDDEFPPLPNNDGEYVNDDIHVTQAQPGHAILNQVLTDFGHIHVEGLTSSLHLNTMFN